MLELKQSKYFSVTTKQSELKRFGSSGSITNGRTILNIMNYGTAGISIKRGINQGRHTFASQLLTSGQVPPEWIAEQLGHSDTSMIYKHYGKLIAEDMPDYITKLNNYIMM